MQFRLRTLLGLTTVLGLFCGVIFAAPLVVTGVVLCLTMWLSPAVWIAGASYAQGGRQAFFRGGLICGILPFVVITYGLGTIAFSGVSIASEIFAAFSPEDPARGEFYVRLLMAGLWLVPGVFACLGGTVAWFTQRWLMPPPEKAVATRYRVIAGRLKTEIPVVAPASRV